MAEWQIYGILESAVSSEMGRQNHVTNPRSVEDIISLLNTCDVLN